MRKYDLWIYLFDEKINIMSLFLNVFNTEIITYNNLVFSASMHKSPSLKLLLIIKFRIQKMKLII